MKILKYLYLVFIFGMYLGACSEEENIGKVDNNSIFEISAKIEPDAGDYLTRVELNKGDGTDNWSFLRFSSNLLDARPLSQKDKPYFWEEAIGFYSNKGNLDEGSDGYFTNEKLIFAKVLGESSSASFISTKMNINLNDLNANGTIAYFPYTEDMETEGLELRWIKNGESLERCIDGLLMRRITSGGGNSISGLDFSFIHAFSEMIIIRGEGFDTPPEDSKDITIVMDRGYSHAKLKNYERADDDNLNYTIYKVFDFVYDENYSSIKSEEACREWQAWPGTYSITQSGTRPEIKEVYYALVPGGYGTGRPSLSHIKICDNNGDWHNVTDFSLYENHAIGEKRLNWGERYLLEIKMEGLVPTVNPVVIKPWGEDVYVAQRDAAGISSVSDFQSFVTAYNQYTEQGRDINESDETEPISTLKQFGDKTINKTSGEVSWHFYFIDNIEFTSPNPTIMTLHENDIIEGYESKLTNLSNSFINNLKGDLIGLKFTVNMKYGGTGVETSAFGAIAKKIETGNVRGCSVSGTINYPEASVGMLAGEMNGGSVENCSFSGLIIGRSTYNKMIGTQPTGDFKFNSNSTSGVVAPGSTDEEL